MRAKRAAERAGAIKVAVMERSGPAMLIQSQPQQPQNQRQRQPLRLNLGAGRFRVDGWQSVDIVPDFQPDYLEDVATLPSFYPDSVDSLYCGHVFEHLSDPIGALLRWFEVLKPGGDICLAMPNHAKAVELWMNAEPFPVLTEQPLTGLLAVTTGFYSFAQYQEMKAKNPLAAAAQQHKRSIDLPVLMTLMEATGFIELEQIDETMHPAAPRFDVPVIWQMLIKGKKPTA